MICGTLQPDGTVAVKLSWTAGTPDPSSEAVIYWCTNLPLPVGLRHILLPGPIQPGAHREVIVPDLLPGSPYVWTVETVFSDGSSLQSPGQKFDTPSVAKTPATNLMCS